MNRANILDIVINTRTIKHMTVKYKHIIQIGRKKT